jgi:hypothetical protein
MPLRDIAAIAKDLPLNFFHQLRDRLAIIDIGGGEPTR